MGYVQVSKEWEIAGPFCKPLGKMEGAFDGEEE